MSRVRSALAAIGVLFATGATALMGAVPASAASNPSIVHFDSTYAGGWTCASTSGSARMNVGDSLRLTWTVIVNGSPQATSASFTFTGPTGNIDVPMTTSAGGSVSFSALGTYTLDPSLSFGCSLTVQVVAEPVAAPPAHDYFQAVGVPASGNCADVPTSAGHFRGYPIGGWSKSWAWWINDGRGGPVCVREVEGRPDGTIVLIG